MGRSVKAVSNDNRHVTLQFLGEIDRNQLREIEHVVDSVVCGHTKFEMRLTGLGAFPHLGRPSVIWAGLRNAEPLVAIAEELQSVLEPLGFQAEKRPFHPHVTLARIKSRPPESLAVLVQQFEETEFGTARVQAIQLFRSTLSEQGPKHSVLKSFRLAAS